MKTKSLFAALTVLVALSAGPGVTRADEIFTVTLNTEVLSTAPDAAAGPFSLAFQLVQGDATNPTNTATVSDFNFGGGSAGACPTNCITFGDVTGDATSTIGLSTSDAFEAIIQTFTPGSQLSFQVDVSTNPNTGLAPDAFGFSILDSSDFPIPTQDPSGADTFLTVLVNSSNPSILTYASDPSVGTEAGNISISLDAPTIGTSAPPTNTPEPSSFVLLASGLLLLLGIAFR